MQQLVAGHQWIDGCVLQRDTDVAAHVVGLGDDVEAGHLGAACSRPEQGREHADDGALAGTIRAEKAEDLALPHFEVDAVDRFHRSEMADEPFGDDGGLRLIGVHLSLACTKYLCMSNCLDG